MVKINNDNPEQDTSTNNNNDNSSQNQGVKRYTINESELTFPIEGMKHGKVIREGDDIPEGSTEANLLRNAAKSVPTGNNNKNNLSKDQQTAVDKATREAIENDPRIREYNRLQRLVYDENVKFIHLPDDPAYRPISLEAIKMNEFENEDLKLNTRIMMNLALMDYVVFRLVNDDGSVTPIPVHFRRVKTNEFQDYVDIQTALDDLVKRVGIIDSTVPFTLELQDQLYETQKRLIKVARERLKKGFEIFFKLTEEEKKLYYDFDNNDISFNVDAAFLRMTKSPF